MKTFFSRAFAFLGIAAAMALAGCNDTHARARSAAQPEAAASTYKAGHGLRLTPAASRFIGLQTAEFKATPLPAGALVRTAKGDFVYVQNGDWLLRTAVAVEGSPATGFTIKEGLYDGDIVVTTGARHVWLAELAAVNGGIGCADHH